MKYIKTSYSVPYFNMALEEYLLNDKKFTDDCVFFYVHSPSVIIGAHQNAYAEINLPYIKQRGIYVSRRLSGGGAVYHDEGNLNYSFVLNRPNSMKIDFAPYTAPVIKTLSRLGIKSELSGRNDILVDGKKFSGNAQMSRGGKLLHHGTLMIDVNVEAMAEALNVSEMKISSKAVASVRSRVVNLKKMLPQGFGVNEFREMLIETFFENSEFEEYILTEDDKVHVQKRVEECFGTDEFNFAKRADFSICKKRKFTAGIIEAGFDIKKGVIERIAFTGDFFSEKDIHALEATLAGVKFDQNAVKERLIAVSAGSYIRNLTAEELTELIFI